MARSTRGGPAAVEAAIQYSRGQAAADIIKITTRFQKYHELLKELHKAELSNPEAATGVEVMLFLGPLTLWAWWRAIPKDPYRGAAARRRSQAYSSSKGNKGFWSCFKLCWGGAPAADDSEWFLSEVAIEEGVQKYWKP
jgi:hypothetical protein